MSVNFNKVPKKFYFIIKKMSSVYLFGVFECVCFNFVI